jgi:Tfp pilus assembly protein PilN
MKAINLLPPDLRGTPKGSAPKAAAAPEEPNGIGAFVVLGALALCVAAFAAYVLTTNTVKDRQAQLDATTAQSQATLRRAAELKPYADFQQMAETRIQTVKDLAASRFDWEMALRDISRTIPADVTLTSINGSISSEAAGGSSVRSAIAAPAVELKGCTTSQKQVAVLLSRLRNVDGVTRVTLTKSQKPEQDASSGAIAADAATADAPCGPGRPPEFEVVMFFERSSVPTSVADITVTPSVSSTPAENGNGGGEATGTDSNSTTTTQPGSGSSTPSTDSADGGTATPASTPQGGDAQ